MNTFPLVRTKWSNEYIMAAVFIVSVLYLLPRWLQNPKELLDFAAVLVLGLLIDVIANIIRHKRLVCAVSAAVTVAVLEVLTPGVPLWGRILGVAFALLAGKHFEGGTGKNILNPAIVGLLLMCLLFDIRFYFTPTFLLLPAIILSIPFIRFRPFAAAGFMAGMISVLIYRQDMSVFNIAAYGVIFLSCLVVTDPVTVTSQPLVGAIAGFLSGFISLEFSGTAFAMALCVLALNIISFTVERIFVTVPRMIHSPFRLKKVIPFLKQQSLVHDFTDIKDVKLREELNISEYEIIRRIRESEVFGFGGAAFPTYEKIKAVMNSHAQKKHLIVNGVECDPGLIHDQWLLHRYPVEIYQGIEALCKCIVFNSVTLAVKEIEGSSYPEDWSIYKVPDYYPAGAEKFLIKEILGKLLPSEVIPSKEGILVLNVQTVYSIYESVYMDKKADARFLTVANMKEKTGTVARVKLGTKVQEVMGDIYPHSQFNSVFCGGGLMQCHIADDMEVIDKTTNFIALADSPHYKESPICSNCGLCTLNCPAGLKVNRIAEMVDSGDLHGTEKYHVNKCMNCGTCSYVCLAGRNLSSRMKTAREHSKRNN